MKTLASLCLFLGVDKPTVDLELIDLFIDSREITPNSVFIALQGEKCHGLDYRETACKQGAKLILSDKKRTEKSSVLVIFVENLAEKLADLSGWFYDNPSQKMKLVGVTGTNGKTSVVHYVAQLCSPYQKVAVLGTLGNGIFGQLEKTANTTLNSVSLNRKLAEFNRLDVDIVLMEVSSHAIALNRIKGLSFTTLALTQVTSDHLDFHGSVEEYREVKRSLFTNYKADNCVLNLDDKLGKSLNKSALNCSSVISYGLSKQTNIHATDVVYLQDGLQTKINNNFIKLGLFGYFNLENIMCALGICQSLGLAVDKLVGDLKDLLPVSGRMEIVSITPTIIIDYAHTEDALLSILVSAKQHLIEEDSKIILVFGCGGDRDKSKRPLMGKVAVKYADKIILTDDNPRFEESTKIMDDILKNISSEFKNIHCEHDREKAIQLAILKARKEDIVIIAGKGHEDYQDIKGIKYPMSDLLLVNRAKALLYKEII